MSSPKPGGKVSGRRPGRARLWPTRSGYEVGLGLRVGLSIVAESDRKLAFQRLVLGRECGLASEPVAEGELGSQLFAIGGATVRIIPPPPLGAPYTPPPPPPP